VECEALPRLGLAHLLPELYSYQAEDLMILGRWDEARAVVDEAARRFPTRKDEATLIELVVAKGDVGEARRLLAAAAERDVFVDKEDQAMVMVNLADLEMWEGNLAAAREAADAALRHVLHSDRPIAAARALRVALRPPPTHARPPGQTWARHRVEAGGPSAGGYRRRRMVPSVGSPDPAAWASAIRATSDLSMVYALAYARFRNGEAIMVATGDRDAATSELRSAHGTARPLGARPLRDLIERFARRARVDIGAAVTPPTGFGLTSREHQVLDLMAQGASNRQIAEGLFISEKTASVHVSNIIRKLGVSSRGEAAWVAYRAGLVPQ
jgi:DNA-binding CsgD family transcriptional regulator